MFIPGNFYPDESDVTLVKDYPKYDFLIDDTTVVNEAESIIDVDWDNLEINYSLENGFFKGAAIAIPISLSIWGGILFILKLIFY